MSRISQGSVKFVEAFHNFLFVPLLQRCRRGYMAPSYWHEPYLKGSHERPVVGNSKLGAPKNLHFWKSLQRASMNTLSISLLAYPLLEYQDKWCYQSLDTWCKNSSVMSCVVQSRNIHNTMLFKSISLNKDHVYVRFPLARYRNGM